MSFTRTKPGGWGTNAKVAATELNDIDLKTSRAVDKTSAGDTISGPIVIGSGGSVTLNSGTSIDTLSGGHIDVESGGKIEIKSGGVLQMDGTVIPTFGSARNRTVRYATCELPKAGGAAAGTSGYVTGTTGETIAFGFAPHDGSILTTVSVYWAPPTGHAGLPANPPSLTVQRKSYPLGATQIVDALSGTPTQFYSPVSLADYNNGNIHKMTFTCTVNRVIDRSQYAYHVIIVDESGANALSGANYMMVELFFDFIADMRWP